MHKKLYLITPDQPLHLYKKKLKAILAEGIDVLQYRRKNLSSREAFEELSQIKLLCDLYQVPLIVNDCISLAKDVQAHGVHLGQSDFHTDTPNALQQSNLIFGRTAKTVEQAIEAENQGAQYIGVGAFFVSSTKTDALPMSIDTLKAIRNAVSIPIYAIGGIEPDKLTSKLLSHVDGICFSGAAFANPMPEYVIEQFKIRLQNTL